MVCVHPVPQKGRNPVGPVPHGLLLSGAAGLPADQPGVDGGGVADGAVVVRHAFGAPPVTVCRVAVTASGRQRRRGGAGGAVAHGGQRLVQQSGAFVADQVLSAPGPRNRLARPTDRPLSSY